MKTIKEVTGNVTKEEALPTTIESLCEENMEVVDFINGSVDVIDNFVRLICKKPTHINVHIGLVRERLEEIKRFSNAILLLRKKEKGGNVTLEELMATL